MANFHGLVFLCLCFVPLMVVVSATQYKVGGSMGWTVPTNPNAYSQWASKNRFKIGDTLLFVYLPDKDSVLLVDADSYKSCNTSSYINKYGDGNTVFTFTKSGSFNFISGNRDNCLKNESVVVVVLADRSGTTTLAPSPSATIASHPPPPSDESTSPPPPNGATVKVVGYMVGIMCCFVVSLLL